MLDHSAIWLLCQTEYESLKDRFGADDKLLRDALISMCEVGMKDPESEIPELSRVAEKLINKWRGDSRGGGLELALISVWRRAQKRVAV